MTETKTIRLYDEKVMLRSCKTVVTACRELKKGFGVELSETVFYPEGGGQLSDTGKLILADKSVAVTHVREKDGTIYHETAESIAVGTEVTAEIDWQMRFDHMQQHCGEHLLSYGFWKFCQADNVGFHMTEEMVTIDLNREVSAAEVQQVETLANAQIQENLPVKTTWMDAEQAAVYATRKFNDKLTGPVRVVSIEGSDVCTCCGTHPPMTGMIGLVKIFKMEKHKDGTRIYFLCGRRALAKIQRCWQALNGASQLLSLKDEEIEQGVERLQAEKKELQDKLTAAEERWVNEIAPQLLEKAELKEDIKFVEIRFEDISADAARKLAQRLAEDPQAQVTLFYKQKNRLNYILARGTSVPHSCRERIAVLNKKLNGHGGGNDNMAQGSCAAGV
ncbi:MAG: alanyl-tRNA editing protein [Selenomonas sp.]|uniref:alanyl-tRNA editing protein n=1 Tax=Selenomonas sp. TaxID=2053611 RepID=UPI0025FF6661|nr:alanine--tRNA ligase-related protein [Selenomonas sp.]MCR5439639.1 alanyl-tRNA editing protein [Selenomonas sp.]